MNIAFTGGHHTSALAVIDALKKRSVTKRADLEMVFFGHRWAIGAPGVESNEFKDVQAKEIPFVNINAGKLSRTFKPLDWLRIPFGFVQAFFLLLKHRPDLIISFGGYLAVPVVLSGWILGIPSVTHEQTVVCGWANKFIARFAKKIFISWPQSRDYFPESKVILTGLPLRKEIVTLAGEKSSGSVRRVDSETKQKLSGLPEWPTVYITGGKQGSRVINDAVEGCVERLLTRLSVIHQCGIRDFEKFLQVENQLPEKRKANYVVYDYFDQEEISRVFRSADFVIGRSGAHTVYELAALGKPAILIPIPWVSHNEQRKNAEVLSEVGSVIILPQEELTPERLLTECKSMLDSWKDFKKAGKKARSLVVYDAADRIVDQILEYVQD
ncbi:MAG: UDP-N-acetylglucosamine--N-acetylmuramyl-(pentapeptide) pyrophosphoryl-undecaprenol N-acetylglucosamine transferase [Patescibacteria group bacterium]